MLRGKQTREQFSEGTGVSTQTLYKYEKQLSIPSIEFVDFICKKFKINYQWLIAGDGPMRPEEVQPISTPQPEQTQLSETVSTISCARCEKLEAKLEKVENQRDELIEENRRLWKENAEIRERAARLDEQLNKPGTPRFSSQANTAS